MGVVSLPTQLTIRGRRFALVERLGEGATSAVWLARSGEEELVVKVGRDPTHRSRLADEAQRLLLVDSSRINSLVGAGCLSDGTPYLALTRAEGESLSTLLERSTEPEPELARVLARDIGTALADLHRSGLSHGDLKPANIVVELDGGRPRGARLVDLGLAGAR
jgi:serine/threonine protein kinase